MTELAAPLKKGSCVGQNVYTYEGTLIGSEQLLLETDAEKKTLKDWMDETIYDLLCRERRGA